MQTIRSISKLLTRKHPKILMYHRVLPELSPFAISLSLFEDQMTLLKKNFNVVPLKELTSEDTVSANSIAITFDDGYLDFYTYIFPVLKKLEIPATLFVTTGFVNKDIWLWPDKLKYLLENTKKKQLYINELSTEFNISEGWFKCWDALSNYYMGISQQERLNFIKSLEKLFNVNLPINAPEKYRGVSWDQLKEISEAGVEIGGHTVSHEILTQIPLSDVYKELLVSKTILKKKLKKEICGLCYPNGMKADFNDEIKKIVSDVGYKYAMVAYPSMRPLSNLMEINRYPVSDNWNYFINTIYGLSYFGMLKNKLLRLLF